MIGEIIILRSSLINMRESLAEDFVFFNKIDLENTLYVEVCISGVRYEVFFECEYSVQTSHDQFLERDFEYVEIEKFTVLGISKIDHGKTFELKIINANLFIQLSNMAQVIFEISGDMPDIADVVDSKNLIKSNH